MKSLAVALLCASATAADPFSYEKNGDDWEGADFLAKFPSSECTVKGGSPINL